MTSVTHQGVAFEVDAEGFLADPSRYSPEWVDYVREMEDIDELTDDHLEVLGLLRGYYETHRRPPRVRDMAEVTGFKLKYIYELFPSGPGKGACRMAGLPKPEGCA
ncbi:MAG: TusE/DsrC/DsvC family sulfur relay protein [Deltaproteobacteria bacterium]|jgi:tRNA 2-thiouridine synthesizing protein E|nr:TusE/DsrC/DsvC family sulfur relay protein [Deltaproteobacteria bacterium]